LKRAWLGKEERQIIAVLCGVLALKFWERIRAGEISVFLKEAAILLAVIAVFVPLVFSLSARNSRKEQQCFK